MKALLIALCVLLASCSQQKQVARKTSWLLSRGFLAAQCERFYPYSTAGPGVVTNTDTLYNYDTLYVPVEPVTVFDTVTLTKVIKCPPATVITKTKVITRDSLVYQLDRRGTAAANDQILKLRDENTTQRELIQKQQAKLNKNTSWLVAFIILLSLNIIYAAFKIRMAGKGAGPKNGARGFTPLRDA